MYISIYRGVGGFSRLFVWGDYGWWNPPLRYRKLYDRASRRHDCPSIGWVGDELLEFVADLAVECRRGGFTNNI
ncbi:hypothetical protein [Microcoleus sp. AR_TQ3_B6]|uniref:hypothetical protein n=1 Tax=Microcoleus sp. AR_TQ3_B6 TaxID=3055284 RepID=UPI002FD01371